MTEAILNRQTFTFSRELEFFSEKELTTQIGLPSEYWLVSNTQGTFGQCTGWMRNCWRVTGYHG